jgi:amidase
VFEAQTPQIAPPFMGLPGLTVATSGVDAPPMGVQLLAGPWREDLLLDAGADIAARGSVIPPVDPRS